MQARLREMAAQVDADYEGRDVLLVGVLKGAVMVMADLARAHEHPRADGLDGRVVSYGSSTKSSGVVRILKDLDTDITGRHVLIVEDIIDSGLTLSWLMRNLTARGAASVEVLTMLRKPEAVKVDLEPKYIGFDIPNEFVVGYGLDYAEQYRNLREIGHPGPARLQLTPGPRGGAVTGRSSGRVISRAQRIRPGQRVGAVDHPGSCAAPRPSHPAGHTPSANRGRRCRWIGVASSYGRAPGG